MEREQQTSAGADNDDANERMIDGRFEVVDILGEGGFGVVYKALQISTGQVVAVKVLHTDLLDDDKNRAEYLGRFEREMKLIAALKHPNIVRLIDSGTLPTGEPYTVLEYIEGETLFDLIERDGPLTPKDALMIMFQVLDALSSAHKLGIVHRDLKPQNIMLTTTGYRRNAMVLDFGIAAVTEEQRSVDYKTLTKASEVCGTPNYMAPEQLNSKKLTAQSDIYAWGLVFIEAMTGQPAVDGDGPLDIIFEQIDLDIPVEVPQNLLHEELLAILQRAVTKPLDTRYESADEVLEDLDNASFIDAEGRSQRSGNGSPPNPRLDTSKPLSAASTPTNDGQLADAATVKFDIEAERAKRAAQEKKVDTLQGVAAQAVATANQPVIVHAPHPDTTRQVILLVLATLVSLLVGGFVGYVIGDSTAVPPEASAAEPTKAKPAPEDLPTIAVLPFSAPTNDTRLDTLAATLSENTSIQVSKLDGFSALPSTSLARDTDLTPQELGAKHNANIVFQGTLHAGSSEDEGTLSVQLIDTTSGKILHGNSFTDNAASTTSLQSKLLSHIVTDLRSFAADQ